MLNLRCSGASCDYQTGEYDPAVAVALLNNHTAAVHASHTRPSELRPHAPRVERPVLTDQISEEHWNGFLKAWSMFVMANGVSTADQPVQLFACCDPDLRAKVTATDDNIPSSNIDEMLKLLRSLSVVPVAINVQRSELLRMQQQPGEAIRTFFSRVRGKAITCRFQIECVSVNYTNDIIKHVVIAGIYNEDVRQDVYGIQDADTMSVHSNIRSRID